MSTPQKMRTPRPVKGVLVRPLASGAIAGLCLMMGPVFGRGADDVAASVDPSANAWPVGALAAPHQTSLTSDSSAMRGYWKLNGNLADSSPWSNHATMSGARYVPGRSGQALKLSGRSCPQVADDPSLELSNGFSLDFWVKLSSYGQTTTLIGSGSLLDDSFNWAVGIQDGALQVVYHGVDGKRSQLSVPENNLPLDTWLHIAAWLSVSENELGLVVHDDVLLTSQVNTSLTVRSLQLQPRTLWLGEELKGVLDEVKLSAL